MMGKKCNTFMPSSHEDRLSYLRIKEHKLLQFSQMYSEISGSIAVDFDMSPLTFIKV